jgi:hypothetical protein
MFLEVVLRCGQPCLFAAAVVMVQLLGKAERQVLRGKGRGERVTRGGSWEGREGNTRH